MEAKLPMPGPGSFQWNRGGWFGSQLGSTAWMIVAAVEFAPQAPWVAAACLFCFALANGIGTWLWSQRDRLRPYPAIQLLILVVGVSGLLAMVSDDIIRPAGVAPNAAWNDEVRAGRFWLLIVVAALMAYFALMERSVKKSKERGREQTQA